MLGGFGTFDEQFESLTLIQTKRIQAFPIIMVGSDFWGGLLDWREKTIISQGNIDKADMMIFNVMDDPDEVVAYIRKTVII